MAVTLADLIEDVASAFGRYKSGTVDSGSDDDTLIDTAALYEPDDFWIGHYVYITADAGGAGAAPEGEERPISDFDQSEGEISVSPAFTADLGAGDTYEILPLRREDITRAINQAVRHADAWFKTETDSTTISLADDDYDYSLPTDVVRVCEVWVREDTDEPWREVVPHIWRVRGEPGSLTLYFDQELDDDLTVRLEYTAYIDELSADTDTLGLGTHAERECVDFIVNYALHWLYNQEASRAPQADAFRSYLTLAEYRREEAERIKAQAGRHQPAGRVHGALPPRSLG